MSMSIATLILYCNKITIDSEHSHDYLVDGIKQWVMLYAGNVSKVSVSVH